jgi:CheY-like chemotaxis protein
MRLRIIKTPLGAIDGVSLSPFQVGSVHDVGIQVACVLLAEGWAEIAADDARLSLSAPGGAARRALVMVVDDDVAVRRLTETMLTAHGYDVLLAAHGADAIRQLEARCPALIVLDLNMPIMDGWQFRAEQRYLTTKAAAVPVLLLTGEEDASMHAETLGAVSAIRKPFDPDDLMDAVAAVIAGQRTGPDGIGCVRPWKRRRPPSRP